MGDRIIQIIREITPPPYDFKERFFKKAGRTFRQEGILEIPRGKENGGGHPHRPLVPLPDRALEPTGRQPPTSAHDSPHCRGIAEQTVALEQGMNPSVSVGRRASLRKPAGCRVHLRPPHQPPTPQFAWGSARHRHRTSRYPATHRTSPRVM